MVIFLWLIQNLFQMTTLKLLAVLNSSWSCQSCTHTLSSGSSDSWRDFCFQVRLFVCVFHAHDVSGNPADKNLGGFRLAECEAYSGSDLLISLFQNHCISHIVWFESVWEWPHPAETIAVQEWLPLFFSVPSKTYSHWHFLQTVTAAQTFLTICCSRYTLLSGLGNSKENIFWSPPSPEDSLQHPSHSTKCTAWVAIS